MVALTLGYLFSCEDETYLSSSDVKLGFSTDTVMFDTVFTTLGSTTQHLKLYNPYDQKVLISSVKLAKGDMSNFRLNINGVSSNEVQDLEIAPFDSLYIFVEVTVDPRGQNLPFVVKDSILFVTNMNNQDVDLVAWGQDFVLIKQKKLKTTTWTNEKPYLVYNYAFVDSNATLTIEPGTKIYFHKEAGLYVKGRVIAKGTVENLADNCLITNCGSFAVALLVGGSYEFNHSTIANYWGGYSSKTRSTPSLLIQNFVSVKKDKPDYVGDLSKATFGNCIITGNVFDENEVFLGKKNEALFNFKFDRCILQVADTFKTNNAEHFVNILKGVNPKFIDPYKKFNFELDTLSPAKDAGKLNIGRLVPTDLKGRDRLFDNAPDLGALERQEKKPK